LRAYLVCILFKVEARECGYLWLLTSIWRQMLDVDP